MPLSAFIVTAKDKSFLGAFQDHNVAVLSIKFSYHRLKDTEFQIVRESGVTTVTATGTKDSDAFVHEHTITWVPIHDEVTHL